MTTDKILEVDNICSYYGQSQIISGISFELFLGSTVMLLGRNGMGKTTLIRSLLNLSPPHKTGLVRFKGVDISNKKSYHISQLGVGFVPQGRRLFPSLTVAEHLEMVYRQDNGDSWSPKKVYELFPEIARRKNNKGTDLSGGEQQMLAIGRTLVTNPDLLLLDEPLEGLAPVVADKVMKMIQTLRSEGLTIFWVEQKAKFITEVADLVYIIEKGKLVYQDSSENFASDKEIKKEFLGV